MAVTALDESRSLTAPALLGMTSRGALALAVALIIALALSSTADFRGIQAPLLFGSGLVVEVFGILAMLYVRSDPMTTRAAAAIGSTGPIACVTTSLSIPGPLANPNQFNALGAGVAVCAFMCVRGRTGAAWCAFAAMVLVVTGWSFATGQGFYGLAFSIPNAAVICMSTLFAVVVRPAAALIRQLNRESIAQARSAAAASARIAEQDRRRSELRDVAWPIMGRIAAGHRFSVAEWRDVRLTEARLRDSVRARSMNTPMIVEAARAARARNVDVVMLDDGALDSASEAVRERFHALTKQFLDRAGDGSVTVRVHPPGRRVVASVVSIASDGNAEGVELDDSGVVHASYSRQGRQPPVLGANSGGLST